MQSCLATDRLGGVSPQSFTCAVIGRYMCGPVLDSERLLGLATQTRCVALFDFAAGRMLAPRWCVNIRDSCWLA